MSTHYIKTASGSAANEEHLAAVRETVSKVIADVRVRGDEAVREYSEQFDGWSPTDFRLSPEEIDKIVASVPDQAIADIKELMIERQI